MHVFYCLLYVLYVYCVLYVFTVTQTVLIYTLMPTLNYLPISSKLSLNSNTFHRPHFLSLPLLLPLHQHTIYPICPPPPSPLCVLLTLCCDDVRSAGGGGKVLLGRGLGHDWHSDGPRKVQLTFSRGKKKKGDKVKDEDDDDVVRTSVSQDRVTVTLCTEELFLCTQYM